ncbi:MAG: DoxX family protein [Proteobacteria bacterium]|nr:DoxX family protein [Pseudomonadota bacterium]
MPELSERIYTLARFAGRLLIAALFLHEGYAKLINYAASVRYAEAFGVPGWMLPGAIAVEIGCGLMLVTGTRPKFAALALAGFSIVTAIIFHRKLAETNQLLHFEKNLAIAGGLLLFAIGDGMSCLGKAREP